MIGEWYWSHAGTRCALLKYRRRNANLESPITQLRGETHGRRRKVTRRHRSRQERKSDRRFGRSVHTSVKTIPTEPGHRSTDIWKTTAMPVPVAAVEADPPGAAGFRSRQRDQITSPRFRRARGLPHACTPAQVREFFKSGGNESASTFHAGRRHPFMHRTESGGLLPWCWKARSPCCSTRGRGAEGGRHRRPARHQS